MLIEIYTENEVSPIDKRHCLENNINHRGVRYTTVGPLYIIYKDIQISKVIDIFNIIIKQ